MEVEDRHWYWYDVGEGQTSQVSESDKRIWATNKKRNLQFYTHDFGHLHTDEKSYKSLGMC